nr:hypothetical protein Hi04_10k_c4335_00007 [uncultured bacterium]
MPPKFSIVIPVYNRREFLSQAIRSCLRQTATEFEVIVSDDCSSEDLRGAVLSFADPRVQYARNQTRIGASNNHQRAVSLAKADYVLVLHSDDMLLPDCLQVAARALEHRPEAAAAYFSTTYLSGSTVEGAGPVPKIAFADGPVFYQNAWLEEYHGSNPTCCLFRKAAFDRIGGYRTALRFAYDWDLYMRLMTVGGGVIFVPEVLAIYRKHAEQAVNTSRDEGLLDVLDLWSLPEYSHWPASVIARLVLTSANAERKRGKLRQLFSEIRRRKLTLKLVTGVPMALLRRVLSLKTKLQKTAEANTRTPNSVDRAIRIAGELINATNG